MSPMQIAIITYLIYLLIIVVINAAALYHFSKYCYPGDITKIVIYIYAIALITVPFITLSLVGIIH